MSNNKPTMPTRIAVEAAYAFTDDQLDAWIAKSGWGEPITYSWEHPNNLAISRVIDAFHRITSIA